MTEYWIRKTCEFLLWIKHKLELLTNMVGLEQNVHVEYFILTSKF